MNKKSMQGLFADAKGVTSSLCGLMLTLVAGATMAQGQASTQAAAGVQPAQTQASPVSPAAAPVATMSRERFDELEARPPIAQRYPAGSIKSDELAQKALEEAAEDRQAAELRYILDQRACYPKFLVSDCLEAARDRKRLTDKGIKAVEYEAKVFQRQAAVDDRDRSLAEQRAKDEEDSARRLAEQKQKEADSARKVKESRAKNSEVQQRIDQNKDVPADYRVRQHEAEVQRQKAEEAARAPARAANAAERQRRIQQAEEHRLEVERKKAENERERAERKQKQQQQLDQQQQQQQQQSQQPIAK
ncbi:hypothetical protein [Herbaspirillum sp. C9C3]|uniref:hypothetical protein n=1 Tax=Herbaspirillum sp. C9C3 TaxID=2735271 RepID=UPI001585272C|nr:hypothetical protein [Herbaspirillum sp. C9C3]NUT62497.1 hypothetical protein [Herbaspirillum sp. C9C3]